MLGRFGWTFVWRHEQLWITQDDKLQFSNRNNDGLRNALEAGGTGEDCFRTLKKLVWVPLQILLVCKDPDSLQKLMFKGLFWFAQSIGSIFANLNISCGTIFLDKTSLGHTIFIRGEGDARTKAIRQNQAKNFLTERKPVLHLKVYTGGI